MAGMCEVEEFDRIKLRQQDSEICSAGGDFGIVLRLAALDIGMSDSVPGAGSAR